jgi:tetratricopeptide (TPR) repeat protein
MKKVFIAFALCVVAAVSYGCAANANSSADTTNSANSANSNANVAVVNVAETPNADVPQPLPDEVPVFTDAKEALDAGKKYFENNRDEQALNAFEQAVKLDPNLGEAHFHLGVAYEFKEENIVNPTPEPTVAGKSAKNKKPVEKPSEKEFKAAIKAYESYLKKNPKDAAANYYLGLSYEKIFEDEKSRKALQEAVKLEPEDSQYQYEYGQILIKLAQYDEAVAALKKSLQLDPENTRAEDALDKATAGKKRVDVAKEAAKKDRPVQPEEPLPPSRRTRSSPKVKTEKPADKPKETAPAAPNSNSR